jgi:hypothetical protein
MSNSKLIQFVKDQIGKDPEDEFTTPEAKKYLYEGRQQAYRTVLKLLLEEETKDKKSTRRPW